MVCKIGYILIYNICMSLVSIISISLVLKLEYRILEFDVILMFKIYHNLSDLQFDNYFIHSKRWYNLRSYEFVIQSKFYASCDQFCNFFFSRIVRIWNSLPYDLVSATSLKKAFEKI